MQSSLQDLMTAGRSGDRVISFPTDTVPALAVRPDRAERIFALKQRSQEKPLILMGGDPANLWSYVTGTAEEFAIWEQVAQTYWPGALTLVLPASDRVPQVMNPADPTTIGLRVPNQAIARTLLTATEPLATTSANLSGQIPLLTPEAIAEQFPEVLVLAPDSPAWKKPISKTPSTVAQWTGKGWKILRQGSISLE